MKKHLKIFLQDMEKELIGELREYRNDFPDATYDDFMGYVAGYFGRYIHGIDTSEDN